MSPEEMTATLRQTLEDHRLSRSERKAMNRLLDDADPDPQTLAVYRHAAFDVAREALQQRPDGPTAMDAAAVVTWLEDVTKLLLPGTEQVTQPMSEAYFSPGERCPFRIAGLVLSAVKSVDICVFTITDNRITEAILTAVQRPGVRVRIVTDDEKSTDRGSDIGRLALAGARVRMDDTRHHMHHKFAIVDGRVLLTGSYNWTRSAASHNEENFIITSDQRLIAPFAEEFETLWGRYRDVEV